MYSFVLAFGHAMLSDKYPLSFHGINLNPRLGDITIKLIINAAMGNKILKSLFLGLLSDAHNL
jgi:hypothetical protein